MRILHAITAPGSGGAELLVLDMAEKLVEQGYEVIVVFLEHRDHDFAKFYLRKLESLGVRHLFLGRHVRKKPLKGALGFRRAIKELKPDVVHCHNFYFAAFCTLTFLSGPKFFYTHHNIKIKASPKIFKLLDRKMHAYIGICNACSDKIEKHTSRPVIKIQNGANMDRFYPLDHKFRLKRSEENIAILYVGNLSSQKNISLLIRGFSIIKSSLARGDIELHIVGDGPERLQLERFCLRIGVKNSVTFHGRKPNVFKYLQGADIFALSSFWEGLPISLIEASLCGLPTITTNVGGCAEIGHEVGNAVVVDSFAPNEYADKLHRLVTDNEFRSALALNARKFSGYYRIERVVREHLKVYSDDYMQ